MGDNLKEALQILIGLGVPKGQQNERTALCLLALTNVKKNSKWVEAQDLLIGITPMMEFAKKAYQKEYAPNTRETFRRQSMHQLIELEKLFMTKLTIVYVTAFPDKQTFNRFTVEIAWETEVWLSDNPTHLIHFNGDKFLG